MVVTLSFLLGTIQPNSSDIVIQFSVQAVHNKQEVGLKHCKTEHLIQKQAYIFQDLEGQ
jgi:hypothetical protein